MPQFSWQNVKFWLWLEIDFPAGTTTADVGAGASATIVFEGLQTPGPQIPGSQIDSCGDFSLPYEVACFDILSYGAEFELNAIPTANVSVAIGRRADNVNLAANIHNYVDQMQLQLPARVWCLATWLSPFVHAPIITWPNSKFKIFEGYVTGSGFRRTTNGAELSLALTHWLTDLNFSSALSKQSHPLNPSQLYLEPNFVVGKNQSGGASFGGTIPGMIGPQLALPFFLSQTVVNDFWGGASVTDPVSGNPAANGLKAWLLRLTTFDRLNAGQIFSLTVGATPGQISTLRPTVNWEACRALSRFEPNAQGPGFTEVGYVYGTPLAMVIDTDLNTAIANSIGVEIGTEGLEGYSNVTLWDKLAGQFHTNYMFSVVPLVEKALVVPFVPGLSSCNSNTLVHRELSVREYESIELSAVMPRPLRAVGVLIGKNFNAGAGLDLSPGGNTAPFIDTIGGWFDKMSTNLLNNGSPGCQAVAVDLRYNEGLIMFKQGPRWMSNVVSNWAYTPHSTGFLGGAGIRTISSIGAGVAATYTSLNGVVGPNPRNLFKKAEAVWNSYARTLYLHEVLKGRQGTITGPVRFDIAPGSSIRVEATEDKYVQALQFPEDEDPCSMESRHFFWCQVLRVSITIDCQNLRGFTTYYVSHIRNENENMDPATSTGIHPLWQKCQWAGCSLLRNDVNPNPSTTVCE